jgi:M6 family metalloprotease-like protein
MNHPNFSRIIGRIVLLAALAPLLAGLATAARLRNVPTPVTQPDGRVVQLLMTGDEFERYLHDQDGFTIVRDSKTRWYVYATAGPDGLQPTSLVAGQADPAKAGLAPGARPPAAQVLSKRQAEGQALGRRMDPGGTGMGNEPLGAPQTGHIHNLVIFVRFAGEAPITETFQHYDDMYNDDTAGANSLYNYLREVSDNLLTVTSTLLPASTTNMLSYQDSHPKNYYQPYDEEDNPDGFTDENGHDRWMALLGNAVEFVADDVPTDLDLDINDDGHIDSICFVMNGEHDHNKFWAYMSNMADANAYIGGKRAWTYDSYPREFVDSPNLGVGVIAHEYVHIMGGPDMYRCGSYGVDPVGEWDVMATNANPPQHMSAWIKYHYIPWRSSMNVADHAGNYWLNPNTALVNPCIQIPSPYSTTEFFLVEYRRKTGTFESSIPDSGMIVYRINTEGENIFGPPDQVFVLRPGQGDTANGYLDKAPFGSNYSRSVLHDNTDPACRLTSGAASGLVISNISAAGGATMAFRLDYETDPPVAPTNLAAYPVSCSEIDLTWNDNSDNEASFDVVYSTAGPDGPWLIAGAAGPDETSFRMSGLMIPEGTYYFKIRATNAIGSSDWTSVVSVSTYPAPPAAPTNLQITTITEHSMALTWNDNADNERGYKIERQTGGSGAWELVVITPANRTSSTVNGLSSGTLYAFRVYGYNQGGASAYSNTDSAFTVEVSGAPAAPTNLTAVGTSSSVIRLTWKDNSGNETAYYVYHKPSSSEFYLQIATIPINSTSYTHMGLNASSSHDYVVRAHNSFGDTASNSATAVTQGLPEEYRILVIDQDPEQRSGEEMEAAIEANGLTVDRVTSVPTTIDPNMYLAVFAAMGDSQSHHTLTDAEGLRLKNYLENSGRSLYLEGGSFFWYDPVRLNEVTPVHECFGIEGLGTFGSNVTGMEGEDGRFTEGIQCIFTQYAQAPDPLQVAAGYTNTYPIWNTPGGSRIVGIARVAPTYTTIGTSTQFGLIEAGQQPYVMAKYLNLFLGSVGLPGAPTDLAGTVEGWSAVALQWTDNATNETGFRIDRQDTADGPWHQIATAAANNPTYRDANVIPGTVSYRVCAFNTAGDSLFSNVITLTTSQPPPSPAYRVLATALSANQIRLTWSCDADNESGFSIFRRLIPLHVWTEVDVVRPDMTTYDDLGVYSQHTYEYYVLAWNEVGEAPASNLDSATTPACASAPGAPAWSSSPRSALPGQDFTLNWTDTSPDPLYEVWESTEASFDHPTSLIVQESLIVRNQTPPAPRYYFYRIRAGRECDNLAEYSGWTGIRHVVVKLTTQREPGDLNGANGVTAADLVILVNYLAGNAGLVYHGSGDVNSDGAVNALDISYILELLADHI